MSVVVKGVDAASDTAQKSEAAQQDADSPAGTIELSIADGGTFVFAEPALNDHG